MKQAINNIKTAARLSDKLIPLLAAAFAAPVVFLTGFGLFVVFRDGYFVWFAGLLAISAFVSTIIMLVLRKLKPGPETIPSIQNSLVEASGDWSDHDNRVWQELNHHIDRQLEKSDKWESLREHALELVVLTAERYDRKGGRSKLAFSAPEFLKMVEEVSRRYRKTLKDNVPFIERVNISTFKMVYDHRQKAGTAKKFYDIYRAFRMVSPAGMLSELRGRLMAQFWGGVSTELQYKMKQAFLKDVLAVSIDLYSGRFKVDDEDAGSSMSWVEDQGSSALPAEPLRICLIGQVSAGKSALVNALKKEMAAEVSRLPSTGSVTVHKCRVEDIDVVHLVDLPGLDGSEVTSEKLLQEAVNSDIVLWVIKASQPSRRLDTDFKARLDEFYASAKNRSRKRPALIGVLTHVDRLKPLSEWQPPYDIERPVSKKAESIRGALDYNKEVMKIKTMIPVSTGESSPHFNLSALQEVLLEEYSSGIQTQLNRRRMEAGEKIRFSNQAKRAIQAGRSLFSALTKNQG